MIYTVKGTRENLSKQRLQGWVNNYKDTIHPRETKNVLIGIDELKKFIEEIETLNKTEGAGINGVRIYMVRQDDYKNYDGEERDKIIYGHTQISLAIVPVFNYHNEKYYSLTGRVIPEDGYDTGGADDYFDNNNEILCLTPGALSHEHSGLCPYNCGGSI